MHTNILFITLDQWRADALSILGHPVVKTPHIDALATDGTLFRKHYTVAMPCGPARASLLTGLYAHNHRSVRNGVPLDARHTNLALELRKAGYIPKLFGFTDTTLDPRGLAEDDPALSTMASVLPGFEEGLAMSGDCEQWVDWLVEKGYSRPEKPRDFWKPRSERNKVDDSPTVYSASESESFFLTDRVIDYLRVTKETPWCVHVSYFRPHHPYIAPREYLQHYRVSDMPLPIPPHTPSEQVHPWLAQQYERFQSGRVLVQDSLPMAQLDETGRQQLRANYFASVAECDAMVGRLIDELKAMGQYDNTLIVVTSDHGDLLGDHGLWASESYFEQGAQVPLIIRLPQTPSAGQFVDVFTESVDVMPTILDALKLPLPDALDGNSLLPLMHQQLPSDWRKHAHWEFDFRDILAKGAQQALGLPDEQCSMTVLRGERYKYVHFAALESVLLDLERDPDERNPCPKSLENQAIELAALREMMSWRMQHEDTSLVYQHIARGK